MPDIIFAVPPTTGGSPSISLQETPHALESYQVTFELNGLDVTFQGTLDALHAQLQAAYQMVDAFIFRQTSQLIPGKDSCPVGCTRHLAHGDFPYGHSRSYQEQARANIRRWSGR